MPSTVQQFVNSPRPDAAARLFDARLMAAAGTCDLLSVPTRLHLVYLLAAEPLSVSELAARSGASIAATSQHLAKLRAAHLVAARRRGRCHVYRLVNSGLPALLELLLAPPPALSAPN